MRGHHEAALALDGLDEHAGHVVRPHLPLDLLDGPGRGLLAGHPFGIAQRIRHGHPVDLGGERSEPVAVGHVLGREGHGQVGAAVVGVVEHHHGLPAGDVAGDLDRVLDGLGPGVEQRRPLVVSARGPLVERLAHGHVLLVRRDHEAGVAELAHLRPDGVHHGRRRRGPR